MAGLRGLGKPQQVEHLAHAVQAVIGMQAAPLHPGIEAVDADGTDVGETGDVRSGGIEIAPKCLERIGIGVGRRDRAGRTTDLAGAPERAGKGPRQCLAAGEHRQVDRLAAIRQRDGKAQRCDRSGGLALGIGQRLGKEGAATRPPHRWSRRGGHAAPPAVSSAQRSAAASTSSCASARLSR